MRFKAKIFCASLFTVCSLFAQGPPPGGPDGFGFGGHGPGGPGFGGPPVTGAPYSAVKTETRQETLTDGNQIQQTHTSKVYRDAEGRTRTESTMTTPSGTAKTMIMIFDPVAGFIAHLNPADSTAMKQTLPKSRTGESDKARTQHTPATDANAPQMVKTDLGASTINGLAATGTRTTVTIAAGAMGNEQAMVETREVWISTALKVPVKMTGTDPRHGAMKMELTDISQAAPDAALFQIPSGYTVKEGHGHAGPRGEGHPDMGSGGPPPDAGSR